MDAQTKERLVFELVQAYTGALTEEGGVGKRTPLHIIFTGKSPTSAALSNRLFRSQDRVVLLHCYLLPTQTTSARVSRE